MKKAIFATIVAVSVLFSVVASADHRAGGRIVVHDAHQADRDTLQTQADRYREVLQPFARGAANG